MRRLIALLAATVVGLVLAVTAAAPAQAAYTDCPSDYVCIFDGTGGSTLLSPAVFRSPGTCYNVTSSQNDKAQSFYNHLSNGHHVQFYVDTNCTGGLMKRVGGSTGPFAPGEKWDFLDLIGGPHYYNVLSSIFFNNG